MTEAAIDTGILRDLYVAFGEPLENGAWVVRVYHKPFVDWIWFGCMLMAFGGALAVTDRRYRLSPRKERELSMTEKVTGQKTRQGRQESPGCTPHRKEQKGMMRFLLPLAAFLYLLGFCWWD